mgnify:CR=1 FL=1
MFCFRSVVCWNLSIIIIIIINNSSNNRFMMWKLISYLFVCLIDPYKLIGQSSINFWFCYCCCHRSRHHQPNKLPIRSIILFDYNNIRHSPVFFRCSNKHLTPEYIRRKTFNHICELSIVCMVFLSLSIYIKMDHIFLLFGHDSLYVYEENNNKLKTLMEHQRTKWKKTMGNQMNECIEIDSFHNIYGIIKISCPSSSSPPPTQAMVMMMMIDRIFYSTLEFKCPSFSLSSSWSTYDIIGSGQRSK